MSNNTENILIVKHGVEITGFILPGESCLLGPETVREMGWEVPEENPCNVINLN